MDETSTPLFISPNVSLFPDEILTDDSSSSLTQPTASPDESTPAMEPVDSSPVVPSSPSIPLPTSPLSQPFVLLRDYVFNSTIVTYEPCTYCETSSNSL